MRYVGESGYRHDSVGTLGVLITNLGTPEAPTTAATRRYLAEFLADPRVIEIPRILWRLILHGIILRTRPSRSAEAYAKVWTEEGSPLLVHSQRQRAALERVLADRLGDDVKVTLAMRYGEPSVPKALEELRAANVRRLLLLPLYPQYCAATTASTFDAVSRTLARWRWIPELRVITQYHDHPGYIAALAASIEEHRAGHPAGDKLLFSFHGIPKRNLLQGDPYHCQCQKTARLVAEKLGLPDEAWMVTFQSRLGRAEWLKPYTAATLEQLPGEGVKRVDVVCAGFSADCLETLEEIEMQNTELFIENGGESLSYVPALNERPDHIAMLADLVQQHTRGWPETDRERSRERDRSLADDSARRAKAMGAEQ